MRTIKQRRKWRNKKTQKVNKIGQKENKNKNKITNKHKNRKIN
jgi:hypothetical protein